VRDDFFGGRAEAQDRCLRARRGDDDEVCAFRIGEREERLLGRPDYELGTNADRASFDRGNVRIERAASGFTVRFVFDDVDGDDFALSSLSRERACNFQRGSAAR
jgi:hypothetical protein